MEAIPGSYPADTPVATPQATPQQEPNLLSQPSSNYHGILGHHDHPERNKLHKPGDPRGHKQADSGVDFGATSSEPIQSTSKEPRTLPILETAEGATYATEGSLPTGKLEDERMASPSPRNQHDSAYTYTRSGTGASDDQPQHTENRSSKELDTRESTGDNTPPYWGNLPKAARGGIYNTVTGHGSPKDDHAQHHNLPQRPAERTHIAGHATDHPRGSGVYNSVAGHGSHDEESKRHDAQDPSFIAPLPEIEEGKPLQLDNTDARRTGLAGGASLPVNEEPGSTFGSSEWNADESLGAFPTTRSVSNTEFGPRAFPLVSDHERHASRQDMPEEARDAPESRSFARDGTMAAASTGAGAALLASENDKRNKLKKRQGSPSEETRGRQEEQPEHKVIGGSLPHRSKEDRESSQSKRESSRSKRGSSRSKSKTEEGSHSPGGKKHSILGLFHRRKGSKSEVEGASNNDSEHHSHRKEEAAAAGAAGAGTYGLVHHHKEKSRDERSASEPVASHTNSHSAKRVSVNENSAASKSHNDASHQRMSGNESAAAALAESAGAFGILYQKPMDDNKGVSSGRSSDATAPSVPSKSEKRRSYSPRSSAALVEGSQLQNQGWHQTQESRAPAGSQVSSLGSHSGSDAMKYAAAGTTAGIGASLFARDHEPSPDSRTGAPAFEHPREPPSAPSNASHSVSSKSGHRSEPSPKAMPVRHSEEVTVKPGNYNSLSSGTPSGVKTGSSRPSQQESHEEKYNHLGSGTASGVKTAGTPARHSADQGDPKTSLANESQTDNYNHLGSGTASGVKTGSAYLTEQQTVSSSGATSDRQDRSEEEYNVLPSGTPSGVKVKPRSQRTSFTDGSGDHHAARNGGSQYTTLPSSAHAGADGHQSNVFHQPQNEAQAARHTLIAAPMPPLGEESPKEFLRQSGKSEYPAPGQAQEMSPEILPDSYKAQSYAVPSAEPTRAAGSKTSASSSNYSEPEHTAKLTNPALAAATGAWAAKAGTSSGVHDQSKVLHKCEHCGKDNDITSQFTRENMAKVNNKPGSTGNWWQNAWTSA